jgi:hypothetical protein
VTVARPAKTPPEPFVAFPKPLYDRVLRGRFTANQYKVVLAVIRYTYGHMDHGTGAYLSSRKIAEAAQLHERTTRTVLAGLLSTGVIVQTAPPKGRRAAKLRLQSDPRRWGEHSPSAPPLRQGANPENLAAHGFDVVPLSARTLPDNSHEDNWQSLCGSSLAPHAGVDARTNCGSRRADSEERETYLLKDGASSADTPPPSCEQEPRSFDLPGYGLVYERDTWAAEQPDSRALYLKTFGHPSRKGAFK